MPLHTTAAPGARNQPRVAGQLVTTVKPADITYLSLDQESNVVTDPRYSHKQLNVRVTTSQRPQLPAQRFRVTPLEVSLEGGMAPPLPLRAQAADAAPPPFDPDELPPPTDRIAVLVRFCAR